MSKEVDKLSSKVASILNVHQERALSNLSTQELQGYNNNLSIRIPEKETTYTLIIDYLTTEGFINAAEIYQQNSNIDPSMEHHTIQRIAIVDAIVNGRTEEAAIRINQYFPEVLDKEPYLYFHLQQLHLIELIRGDRLEEALTFAKTHLSKEREANPLILYEIERTMALLAFEDPISSPFGDLLQPQYRQNVANEFNTAILKQL